MVKMQERYDFQAIEKKWQKYWKDNETFKMGRKTRTGEVLRS